MRYVTYAFQQPIPNSQSEEALKWWNSVLHGDKIWWMLSFSSAGSISSNKTDRSTCWLMIMNATLIRHVTRHNIWGKGSLGGKEHIFFGGEGQAGGSYLSYNVCHKMIGAKRVFIRSVSEGGGKAVAMLLLHSSNSGLVCDQVTDRCGIARLGGRVCPREVQLQPGAVQISANLSPNNRLMLL